MSGRRTLAITRRILQGLRRDRRSLGLLFAAPLVILALLGYLLRSSSEPPPIGVVDQDCGTLGARVTQVLLRSPLVGASRMELHDAQQRTEEGSLAGYVRFPCTFSSGAQSGAISPEIHLEGSEPTKNTPVVQAAAQAVAAAIAPGNLRVFPRIAYVHGGPDYDTLDYFGPAFIGLIVFFLVFVITSVSFLRERAQGTLERLMATPVRRSEIVLGYMLGFSAVALVQSVIVLLFSLYALHLHTAGNIALVFLVEALLAVAAVNLGIFLSMFARSEFQAVQFIPLVIVPQFLLSGIIVPVSGEPAVLRGVSSVLPLTYAVYGLRDVMIRGVGLPDGALGLDIAVVAAYALVLVGAAAMTLRRRVA